MDDAKLREIVTRIERIKNQTEEGYRDVIEPRRPDSEAVKEAKRELKNVRDIQRATDVIASLEEDLATGNLQNTSRRQSLQLSDELSRLNRRMDQLKGAKAQAKRVASLREKAKKLKQDLVTGEREKAKKRLEESKEIENVKREIKELRDIMRTRDQIADLGLQIATGDFKVTPQRKQRIISDELERARVELNKRKKMSRQIIASMQPMTRIEMATEITKNLPRTLLATADMSAVGRQGPGELERCRCWCG
jgi:hypothetical protein